MNMKKIWRIVKSLIEDARRTWRAARAFDKIMLKQAEYGRNATKRIFG